MIPKILPKGTTLEQWEAYEKRLEEHNARYEAITPKRSDYANHEAYKIVYDKWLMAFVMDAPNKPGSEFSNND